MQSVKYFAAFRNLVDGTGLYEFTQEETDELDRMAERVNEIISEAVTRMKRRVKH